MLDPESQCQGPSGAEPKPCLGPQHRPGQALQPLGELKEESGRWWEGSSGRRASVAGVCVAGGSPGWGLRAKTRGEGRAHHSPSLLKHQGVERVPGALGKEKGFYPRGVRHLTEESWRALMVGVNIWRFAELFKELHSISLEQEIHPDLNFLFLHHREEQEKGVGCRASAMIGEDEPSSLPAVSTLHHPSRLWGPRLARAPQHLHAPDWVGFLYRLPLSLPFHLANPSTSSVIHSFHKYFAKVLGIQQEISPLHSRKRS